MENILAYYEFSEFINDNSETFSNTICYCKLNEQHFLIFEKVQEQYKLYVSRYTTEEQIGKQAPEILELLIEDYDKSIPEHRVTLRKYLE